ncbi:MAG: DUF4233 domain-containing protein [Actinomycetota bacterium]|nr:DUF4233 domain-containing protein [Nocardioidaceae bacterium]MDQ3592816.1 DUF4233 domain-containing protein [Actinomycetota bacterium]
MAAAVLAFEAVVIALSVPVLIQVSGLDPAPALFAGLGLALLAVMAAGLLSHRWAYGLGWAVQAGALALGFLTSAMFVVGLLFGGLWVLALVLGRRVEALKAQREAGGPPAPAAA